MITLTKQTIWCAGCKKSQMGFRDHRKTDHVNQTIKLTVITLSGLHCNTNFIFKLQEEDQRDHKLLTSLASTRQASWQMLAQARMIR
jgi:hypothetical protein